MSEPNLKHISVKKLVRKNKLGSPFSGLYGFSPYMACSHACRYCDGRAERYHVEGDFDHDIVIRENAAERLRAELPRLREWGPICVSSGVSDPYQPIEKEKQLTRQCAEILAESNFPVIIHTKSALALNDLDLWHKLHQKAPACSPCRSSLASPTMSRRSLNS
jgi:DNA repair photolyase